MKRLLSQDHFITGKENNEEFAESDENHADKDDEEQDQFLIQLLDLVMKMVAKKSNNKKMKLKKSEVPQVILCIFSNYSIYEYYFPQYFFAQETTYETPCRKLMFLSSLQRSTMVGFTQLKFFINFVKVSINMTLGESNTIII